MNEEQKRKLAGEVLTDEMSDFTMKHINEIRYLQDWIIDAMIEFSNKVNNVALDDVMVCEHETTKIKALHGRFYSVCIKCGEVIN